MSPIGYASFVATEMEPPVAASTTGRNANAAPSAVVASATKTVEPQARVERDHPSPNQQDDRRVGAGIQREPQRVGGGGRRDVPVDDHEHRVDTKPHE
jgi:hypothetical protein